MGFLSDSAVGGGAAAESVHSASVELGERASRLRGEVERFLQALTRAGDRRRFERHASNLPCRVSWQGGSASGRLVDIALGGAGIDVVLPLPTGAEVSMSINSGPGLPARIARTTDRTTGLMFVTSAGTEAEVEQLIGRRQAA